MTILVPILLLLYFGLVVLGWIYGKNVPIWLKISGTLTFFCYVFAAYFIQSIELFASITLGFLIFVFLYLGEHKPITQIKPLQVTDRRFLWGFLMGSAILTVSIIRFLI